MIHGFSQMYTFGAYQLWKLHFSAFSFLFFESLGTHLSQLYWLGGPSNGRRLPNQTNKTTTEQAKNTKAREREGPRRSARGSAIMVPTAMHLLGVSSYNGAFQRQAAGEPTQLAPPS